MVKRSDLSRYDRDHVLMKQLPPLQPFSWAEADKTVSEMKFAVITTAGLHFRGEHNFELSDASYRVTPGNEDTATLIMSHVSTNFDRSEDSEALLDELWSHAIPEDYIVEQNWTRGDVIIWDNRRCLHRRSEIDPSTNRLLLRCQVLARAPVVVG